MLDVVSKLHSLNIVHYDIKGDNFLTASHEDAALIEEGLAALAARGDAHAPPSGRPGTGDRRSGGDRGGSGKGSGSSSASGSGSGSGSSALGPKAWPPRPPDQQLAGGPRRPSRAGPRSLESSFTRGCSSGGSGSSGGAAIKGAGGCGSAADAEGPAVPLPVALVLADFGEAVVYGSGGENGGGGGSSGAGAASFTARHRGSAAFMSPEMHMLGSGIHSREHAHYDRRRLRGAGKPHDVWSLGCCLYELLVGRPLFVDEVGGGGLCVRAVDGGGRGSLESGAAEGSCKRKLRENLVKRTHLWWEQA